MAIIRVFPRKTSLTPTDEYAFIGDPPMIRPPASEIHVSCAFSWDVPEAFRLRNAWRQYYQAVYIGGPAFGMDMSKPFVPGRYIKEGVTFSSRGCENHCAWCLVPEREGKLRLLDPIPDGWIIQDNNFLQTPKTHRLKVYEMLSRQRKAAVFVGGLQASLLTDEIAKELQSIRISELFLAADTDRALGPLKTAIDRLSFLGQTEEQRRQKIGVYVLIGFNGDTVAEAERRLEAVWQAGGMPRARLYQPADRWIDYTDDWRRLNKLWNRPAMMVAAHKEVA